MRFRLQRLVLYQPLANNVCPAKSQRQHCNQLPQSFWFSDVSLLQTEPPTLHTSKQCLNLPPPSVVSYGSLSSIRASQDQILSCPKLHPADMKRQAQYTAGSFKHYWLTNAEAVELDLPRFGGQFLTCVLGDLLIKTLVLHR
jgi:hypothetical protein